MVATYSGRLCLNLVSLSPSQELWALGPNLYTFWQFSNPLIQLGKSCSWLFFFSTTTYSAHVFEGHPFIVEAGVSVGGKDVKQVGFSTDTRGRQCLDPKLLD